MSVFDNIGSESVSENYNFALGDLGNFVEEMRIPKQDMNLTEDVELENETFSDEAVSEDIPFKLDGEFGELAVEAIDVPVAWLFKWWSMETEAEADMFGFTPKQKKTLTKLTNKVLEKRNFNLSAEGLLIVTLLVFLATKGFSAHQMRLKNKKLIEQEKMLESRQLEIDSLTEKLKEKNDESKSTK